MKKKQTKLKRITKKELIEKLKKAIVIADGFYQNWLKSMNEDLQTLQKGFSNSYKWGVQTGVFGIAMGTYSGFIMSRHFWTGMMMIIISLSTLIIPGLYLSFKWKKKSRKKLFKVEK